MHVSYSFPSEWIVLGEGVLLGLVVVLAFRYPAWAGAVGQRVWLLTKRLPHKAWSPLLYLLVGALGAASVCLFLGRPVPRVTDELSYLLAADTFAHGRLSNPTPELAEHFVQEHVVTEPTRMGKYPPASALVLALGQKIGGHPAAGLWLQAGVLAVSMYWLVAALMRPPWPGIAALFVIVRLGIGSYWHQSYWGGGLAAIGGCLVLGAVLRLWKQPRARDGWWLSVGVILLANTRYYEGLLFVLPSAAGLLFLLCTRKSDDRRRLFVALLTGVPLLIVGGALMMLFNVKVTGDPWQLPHLAHTQTDQIGFGHFLWTNPDTSSTWPRKAIGQLVPRTLYMLQFVLGLPVTLALVLFFFRIRERLAWIVGASVVLLLVGLAATTPWFHHYAAPLTGGLILLTMLSLERLHNWHWRNHQVGTFLVAGALVLSCVSAFAQIRAFRADPDDWSYRREEIHQKLNDTEGNHLVLVRYLEGTASQWVSNPSDLATTKVLWAIEQSPADTTALLRTYPDRTSWLLEVTEGWLTEGPVRLDAPEVSRP